MWICEVFADGSNVPIRKLLRGPSVTIGRKAECNISFPNDKSVSRNHAEILIKENRVYVSDFGSKFCSFIISGITKVQVAASVDLTNKLWVEVKHNDIVQIGATVSRLRFRVVNVELCPTKLEKAEKEELKRLSNSLSGFKVVNNLTPLNNKPDNVDIYVVASKFVATVKILESIVYQYPIVTIRFVRELISLLSLGASPLVDLPNAAR